jgi:manganese-dependent inorganic pyrophosphatase
MKHSVTSYRNPDLDGVASAIGRAHYLSAVEGVHARAVVVGELDAETTFALTELKLGTPERVDQCAVGEAVHLVDTHHLSQVHGHVDPASVMSAIDHHPAGTPEAFPQASIINEPVGAVATLVAEMLRSKNIPLEPAIWQLLHAAILSNTLNFAAPTTTQRDRDMAAWLEAKEPLPPGFSGQLLASRAAWITKSTDELLADDYKEWNIGGKVVGISQLEIPSANLLLARTDLSECLRSFVRSRAADHVFLSVVDIDEAQTWLVAPAEATQRLIMTALGANFTGDRAVVDRILLRKSDLVPGVRRYLEDLMST